MAFFSVNARSRLASLPNPLALPRQNNSSATKLSSDNRAVILNAPKSKNLRLLLLAHSLLLLRKRLPLRLLFLFNVLTLMKNRISNS